MEKNVGRLDRWVRVVIGLGIIAAGVAYDSWWGLIGIVPFATALTGWCPLYFPLKISTTKK